MRLKIDLAAAVAAAATHTPAQMTLAELVRAFNVANNECYDWRLKKWLESFGGVCAWQFSSEQIEIAAEALLKAGYKPATVNRDLSALGTCYKWARQQRLCPKGFKSPTIAIRRYDEGIRRVEVSAEEISRLKARSLAFSDRRFGAFVHLLIDTGARKGELLERTWNQVDLGRGEILVPTTKTDVPRVLHFRPETARLLERIYPHRRAEQLLFEGRVPGLSVDYRASWRNLVAEIGRKDLHMHDIRHAAAANLLRAGVTLGVAAQVLGHDPAVLARRYGHLETAALRAAQEQAWKLAAA